MKNILTIALLTFATALFAEDIKLANDAPFYRAGEFTIESFAATKTPDFAAHQHGVGFGIGYFITEHSGVRVSTFTHYLGGRSIVDTLGGSYIYRIPINKSAIYGLAGCDYDLEQRIAVPHIGVGVEHRFVKNFGLFAEASMEKQWNINSSPTAAGRAGFRINF